MKIHFFRTIFLSGLILEPGLAHAICFAQISKACSDTYWHEAHHIQSTTLPDLERRTIDLRNQIQSRQTTVSSLRSEINQMHQRIADAKSTISQFQSLITQEEAKLKGVQNSIETINHLNQLTIESLPRLISTLVQFLKRPNLELDARIDMIQRKLNPESSTLSEQERSSLQFELNQLENVRFFSSQFGSHEEFNLAIETIRTGGVPTHSHLLSYETIALLKEASTAKTQYEDSVETYQQLELTLSTLSTQISSNLYQFKQNIPQYECRVQSLQSSIASKSSQINSLNSAIGQETNELNSIPAQVQHFQARLRNVDRYWHCCDNAPYCTLFAAGQAPYEEVVYSQVNDNRCK